MNKLIFTTLCALWIVLMGCSQKHSPNVQISHPNKPKISFTFDDGLVDDMPNYKLGEWNELILKHLAKHQLKAIFFSMGFNKVNEKGRYVLSSWNNAGHRIANHTFSHPSFGGNERTFKDFELELMKNDSMINQYSNFIPYFRFPYLKEGNTKERVDGFKRVLQEKGYKNGHVSIDASDWYIDARLVTRLKQNPDADVSGFKKYYLEHLFDRAMYYDSLSYQLTQRRVNHVLLLHHNLAAAMFLDDLIQHFKDKGWEVMDAEQAYKDKIYEEDPAIAPAGESFIWALAKKSGKFTHLRYPAEDSEYEKPKMDKLGL